MRRVLVERSIIIELVRSLIRFNELEVFIHCGKQSRIHFNETTNDHPYLPAVDVPLIGQVHHVVRNVLRGFVAETLDDLKGIVLPCQCDDELGVKDDLYPVIFTLQQHVLPE